MRPLILLADDDKNIRNAIKIFLQEDRYAFIEAENGSDAIEIAKKYMPNLILLDIVMPDKDGYEVCKELKSNPDTEDLQIIMLTVKQDKEAIAKSIEMGADDYISKPFTRETLRAKIEHIFIGELMDSFVPERRRTIRKIYPLSVTWGWRKGAIFEVEFRTRMIDISASGFSFEHKRCDSPAAGESHRQCPLAKFTEGDPPLVLTFMIEFPNSKVVEVQGIVRHVYKQADLDEKIGVEFTETPIEVKSVIEEFVSQ